MSGDRIILEKVIEALDLVTGERLYRLAGRRITMTETAAPARFVAKPRTEAHGEYENKCFIHYVSGSRRRCSLQGSMVQSDAEWLANKMNTQFG